MIKIDLPFECRVVLSKLENADGFCVKISYYGCGRYENEVGTIIPLQNEVKIFIAKTDPDYEDVGSITISGDELVKYFQYPYRHFFFRDKETEYIYFFNKSVLDEKVEIFTSSNKQNP
ncbi:MAG: hypothetical protein K2X69_14980 [Silvanigrellaceae bacterium]|nr:hypothetical protein [Silvanigrellaceae bacterium]